MIFGPVDHPGEAILLSLLMLVLGIFSGLGTSWHIRRSVPFVGSQRGFSQSIGGKDPVIYRSYDATEALFEFIEPALAVLVIRAFNEAPFVGAALGKSAGLPKGWMEDFPVTWILQTLDSRGRPVFLDEPNLMRMISFSDLTEDSTIIDRFVSDLEQINRALVDSGRSESRGKPGSRQ